MARLCTNHASEGAVASAAAIFDEYGNYIRAIIRFQTRNQFQAEDLFQQFFLVLAAKPIPARVVNIKSYLYRAVANTVIESARREVREKRCREKHADEARISINNRTPQSAIISKEETESVFRSLAGQLRRREAEAVTLRYRDNCSITEIAEKMGVDRRTVSHYLSEGLKQLRRVRAIE
ncbi:MAG: RNA polymerase sigma factor [Phycisphaerales bacterium]|nr:MAG: RNA polymerase sigma factor [Phycisphaerales bacterium]